MKKRRIKENGKEERQPFTTYHRGASKSGWSDHEPTGWNTPLKTAIELTKKSATADDDILRALVYSYENALVKCNGSKETLAIFYKTVEKEALAIFWETVEKAVKKNLLSEEEYEILFDASLAPDLGATSISIPFPINQRYIKAVQILVKANPDTLKLPFVRDTMINLLRRQKYTPTSSQDLKDIWLDFLHKRPKGKKPYSTEALKSLYRKAKKDGVESLKDEYERLIDEGLEDKNILLPVISRLLGVSEDFYKKRIAKKGQRGRPQKKSK